MNMNAPLSTPTSTGASPRRRSRPVIWAPSSATRSAICIGVTTTDPRVSPTASSPGAAPPTAARLVIGLRGRHGLLLARLGVQHVRDRQDRTCTRRPERMCFDGGDLDVTSRYRLPGARRWPACSAGWSRRRRRACRATRLPPATSVATVSPARHRPAPARPPRRSGSTRRRRVGEPRAQRPGSDRRRRPGDGRGVGGVERDASAASSRLVLATRSPVRTSTGARSRSAMSASSGSSSWRTRLLGRTGIVVGGVFDDSHPQLGAHRSGLAPAQSEQRVDAGPAAAAPPSPAVPAPRSRLNRTVSARSSRVWPVRRRGRGPRSGRRGPGPRGWGRARPWHAPPRNLARKRCAVAATSSASAAEPGRRPWSTCTAVTSHPAATASTRSASRVGAPGHRPLDSRAGRRGRCSGRAARQWSPSLPRAVRPSTGRRRATTPHPGEPRLRAADLGHGRQVGRVRPDPVEDVRRRRPPRPPR